MKSGLTRVIAKSPLFADKLWMVVAWHIASDGKKQKTKCFREKKSQKLWEEEKGNSILKYILQLNLEQLFGLNFFGFRLGSICFNFGFRVLKKWETLLPEQKKNIGNSFPDVGK